MSGIGSIAAHLLLPFLAGQILQAIPDDWMRRHPRLVRTVDRVSVLLMVYAVISAATVSGMWSRLPASNLLVLALIDAVLLLTMLGITAFAARRLGLARGDEIAVVFCGSKKSLVTGIPMATALFAGSSPGLVVLPLMIFHQLQLMACATLAQRYASRDTPPSGKAVT